MIISASQMMSRPSPVVPRPPPVVPRPAAFWESNSDNEVVDDEGYINQEYPNDRFSDDVVHELVGQAMQKSPGGKSVRKMAEVERISNDVAERLSKDHEYATLQLKKLYAEARVNQGRSTEGWCKQMVMHMRDKLIKFLTMLYTTEEQRGANIVETYRKHDKNGEGGFTGKVKGIASAAWETLMKVLRSMKDAVLSLLIWMLSSTHVWLSATWALLKAKKLACRKYQIMVGNFQLVSQLDKSREDGEEWTRDAKKTILLQYDKIVEYLPSTVTRYFELALKVVLAPFALIPGLGDSVKVVVSVISELVGISVEEFIHFLRINQGLDHMIEFFSDSCSKTVNIEHARSRDRDNDVESNGWGWFMGATKDFLGADQEYLVDMILRGADMPKDVYDDFEKRNAWNKMQTEFESESRMYGVDTAREHMLDKYKNTRRIRDEL